MKKGFGHIIVGGTGSGKSTVVKKLLLSIPNPNNIYVYDINKEYYHDVDLESFEGFSNRMTKVKNGVIIFEEATIFLDSRGSNNDLKKILVRKRHTGNYIIMVFHSIRAVPHYLINLCNYFTLLETNDTPQIVKSKFGENIIKLYNDVKKNKKYYSKTIRLYGE